VTGPSGNDASGGVGLLPFRRPKVRCVRPCATLTTAGAGDKDDDGCGTTGGTGGAGASVAAAACPSWTASLVPAQGVRPPGFQQRSGGAGDADDEAVVTLVASRASSTICLYLRRRRSETRKSWAVCGHTHEERNERKAKDRKQRLRNVSLSRRGILHLGPQATPRNTTYSSSPGRDPW